MTSKITRGMRILKETVAIVSGCGCWAEKSRHWVKLKV